MGSRCKIALHNHTECNNRGAHTASCRQKRHMPTHHREYKTLYRATTKRMAQTVTKATYNIWQRKKAAIDAKQSPMQEQNAPKETTLTNDAAHGAVDPESRLEWRASTKADEEPANGVGARAAIPAKYHDAQKVNGRKTRQIVRNRMARKANRQV